MRSVIKQLSVVTVVLFLATVLFLAIRQLRVNMRRVNSIETHTADSIAEQKTEIVAERSDANHDVKSTPQDLRAADQPATEDTTPLAEIADDLMPSRIIQEAIEAAKAGESGEYEIDLPGGAKGRVIIQQTLVDGAGISKDDIMRQLGEGEAKVEIISIDTRNEAQTRED